MLVKTRECLQDVSFAVFHRWFVVVSGNSSCCMCRAPRYRFPKTPGASGYMWTGDVRPTKMNQKKVDWWVQKVLIAIFSADFRSNSGFRWNSWKLLSRDFFKVYTCSEFCLCMESGESAAFFSMAWISIFVKRRPEQRGWRGSSLHWYLRGKNHCFVQHFCQCHKRSWMNPSCFYGIRWDTP